MKYVRHLASVLLWLRPGVGAAEAVDAPQSQESAQKTTPVPSKDEVSQPNAEAGSGTSEELLLFFEEKDLVTPTKRSTPLRKAPAIATIVTAEEIRNMGARNLLDVLKMVPGFGIAFNERGNTIIEVRGIRGSANEKILLMVDGHSLNQGPFRSGLHNIGDTLPIEGVKRVEVVLGPGSALYGTSAFVATVNVITRDAEEIDGLEPRFATGTYYTFQGSLVGGKAIGDKLKISGSADFYQTRGQHLLVESDALRGTPFTRAPGPTDLSMRQVQAFLKAIYGDLSFRGSYEKRRKATYIGFGFALVDNSFDDIDYYWGELAYGHRLSDILSVNVKVYADNYGQDPPVKIEPNGFGGGFPEGMIDKPLARDAAIGIEPQVDWDVFEKNHLIGGVKYEYVRQYGVRQLANFDPLTGAFLGPVQVVAPENRNVTRLVWAAYLQDEWEILGRLNLSAGLRYDHYSDFGGTLSPRVGLVWKFLEKADLKLLYGQAFRAPNFVELYVINNPVVLGNPHLRPETIKTPEASLEYRFSRHLAVNLDLFYSVIDSLITEDASTTPKRFSNIGGVKTLLSARRRPDIP